MYFVIFILGGFALYLFFQLLVFILRISMGEINKGKYIEEERKYYNSIFGEGIKMPHDKEMLQKEFKERIDFLLQERGTIEESVKIFSNFFPRIPLIIFLESKVYSYFEYLVAKSSYDIGKYILWSTYGVEDQINDVTKREIEVFVKNDYRYLCNLVANTVNILEETTLNFFVLRYIQVATSQFMKTGLEKYTNVEFLDMDDHSLDECLFYYYEHYGKEMSDPTLLLFVYKLINHEMFGTIDGFDYYNFIQRREEIINMVQNNKEQYEMRLFEKEMKKEKVSIPHGYTIQDVDLMDGPEFEHFVADLFRKMGYQTRVTNISGDYGIDVLAERDGSKIGIQAKCYSSPVGNSAIQEVVAGMSYYKCDRGVVVTNNKFTKAAKNLADANNIKLWDRQFLIDKIAEIFSE